MIATLPWLCPKSWRLWTHSLSFQRKRPLWRLLKSKSGTFLAPFCKKRFQRQWRQWRHIYGKEILYYTKPKTYGLMLIGQMASGSGVVIEWANVADVGTKVILIATRRRSILVIATDLGNLSRKQNKLYVKLWESFHRNIFKPWCSKCEWQCSWHRRRIHQRKSQASCRQNSLETKIIFAQFPFWIINIPCSPVLTPQIGGTLYWLLMENMSVKHLPVSADSWPDGANWPDCRVSTEVLTVVGP